MAPKILKRIRQALWPICCITFDDVDVTEPPYGENPSMDSEEDYINRMVTPAQESNKKRTAHPKQYLATAHEIAPRRIGEKQAGT
ncbi:hypothetical protein AVEN_127499-1 [Araneus ventricosus]|uniref:Uncharacterized protein n=1 Tax=Araneus ventricosus TaxID=182803 RepID=A0A4Y2P120_ARAVE|nr:hypothetical protein AVEN_127499-1 [Araneus ventricosus]